MAVLTVAAAQIACSPGDISANLDLHLEKIDEARSRGVDLLVFPELSLTGYLSRPDVGTLARGADCNEIMRLAETAKSIAISFGFIERAGERLAYNAQAIVSDGRVLNIHRKINLPTYGRLEEGRRYAPGRSIAPLQFNDDWIAATLICADAWNPALPWLAALQGANLLVIPAASALDAIDGFDNPGGWDVNLRHSALTYGAPVIFANHCGASGGFRFWGGSRILDASGRELSRAGDDEALIVATLDLGEIIQARSRLPTICDADPDVALAELQRIIAERSL